MKTLFLMILFLLITGYNFSQNMWYKYEGNPTLTGTPGNWDAQFVSFSSVIKDTVYKMWYSGGVNFGIFNDTKIGYATSGDGLTWFKHSDPVFSKGNTGAFDEGMVACVCVIFDEGIYKMWYIGTHFGEGDTWRIGYATSPDGIIWTRENNGVPVLDLGSAGEWDDGFVGHPSVIRDGNLLKMWYLGTRNLGTGGNIGYAYSSDGINWTKYNDPATTEHPYADSDPVFTGSGESWDEINRQQPTVIKKDSLFEMWYSGIGNNSNFPRQNFGYAHSSDGINWVAESQPVLINSLGAFDNSLLAPNVILGDDQIYRMWYTGYGGSPLRWRIGYAASDPNAVPVELKNFSAVTIGNSINIIWTTATELNNYGFELFRNGYKIAFVEGNGTTTQKQDYIYQDKDLKDGIYNYRLEQLDFNGRRDILSEVTVYLTIPKTFSLSQNYPNPFNPTTSFSWQSPFSSHQTLKVYDLLGREVATLVDEFKPAGSYEIEFDASQLSSGTYFYKLQADGFVQTRKMILMK